MTHPMNPNFRFLITNPCHFVALGLGSGLIPKAPGTFGTMLGFPIYFLIQSQSYWIYILTVIALFFVGAYCAGVTARNLNQHDHRSIVIDEVVGILIGLFMCPADWRWWLAVFILFRIFDIYKPFPINLIDQRVTGGKGVMLDDVLAGVFTLIIIQIAVFFV